MSRQEPTAHVPAMVTGIGVVAPNGVGHEAYWDAVLAGKSGIEPTARFDPTRYPVRLSGEVRGLNAADHLPTGLLVQTDWGTQLGLIAAQMALADAGLEPASVDEYDMAVVTSSACGGAEFGQREIENLWSRGPRMVGPYQSIAWFYAATTGQISIRHGMRGACGVVAAEQAGGLEAVAQSRRLLRRGDARVVVVGGTESSISPYGLVAQLSTDELSTRRDPGRAYLPFDNDACGYVPAEGGAMLIVEEQQHAEARGAPRCHGQIAGCAAGFDPGGRAYGALRRVIERALAAAGAVPAEVDAVFADAVAVPELDEVEATVLRDVFGPCGVPVAAPKALVGRLHAGGGAMDVVAALLAIRDGVLPPCGGARPAIHHRIDLVTTAREVPVRTALVLARGHGGFHAAVVVKAL